MKEYVFTYPIENVSIGTAVQDIFSIKSGTGSPVEIHHIHLESTNSAAAALRMRLRRCSAITLGSGGTAASLSASYGTDDAGPAPAATLHINDTSQATGGTFTTLEGFNWDTVLPFDYLPAPEDREKCKAGGEGFVLDLPATITATTVSGFFKWSEV